MMHVFLPPAADAAADPAPLAAFVASAFTTVVALATVVFLARMTMTLRSLHPAAVRLARAVGVAALLLTVPSAAHAGPKPLKQMHMRMREAATQLDRKVATLMPHSLHSALKIVELGEQNGSCADLRQWSHVQHHAQNGRSELTWSRRGCRIEIEIEGDIEFTEELDGILRISRGGAFRLAENSRDDREVQIETAADGRLVYTYEVDGRRREFDAEGRAWLQSMLELLFRSTSYGIDKRVALLLRRGGHDAVLDEIPNLSGDYLQRLYLVELMKQTKLNTAALQRVVQVAGREIGSDYELAQLLVQVAGLPGVDTRTREAMAAATHTIGSDYEQRRALAKLLEGAANEPTVLRAVLTAAQDIGSDYELAQLLIDAPVNLSDVTQRDAFFAAVATIDSDYEQRRVLSRIVSTRTLDADALAAVLRSARSIGSDYELAELLVAIAERHPLTGATRDEFVRTADEIGSKHEHGRVSSVVMKKR